MIIRLLVIWFQLIQFEEKYHQGKFIRKLMSTMTSGKRTTVIVILLRLISGRKVL